MEADADPEELTRLRSVFATYDTNGSGRLERAEFSALCAELHVAEAEAEAVFRGLDTDRDGAITFPEFARGFRGALGRDSAEAQGAWEVAEPESPSPAWRDFHARLGDEAQLIPRCVVRRTREACASQTENPICESPFLFDNWR
jgi:Ras and EF-hand domain-containing protein